METICKLEYMLQLSFCSGAAILPAVSASILKDEAIVSE